MKKKYFYILFLSIIISCEKDLYDLCSQNLLEPNSQRIESIYGSSPQFVVDSFEYNDINTLSKVYRFDYHYHNAPGSPSYYHRFEDHLDFKYTNNRLSEITDSINSRTYGRDVIHITPSGLPHKIEHFYKEEVVALTDLIYDKECRLIKQITERNYQKTNKEFYYENDNVVKLRVYTNDDNDNASEYEFEYDNQKNPLFGLGILQIKYLSIELLRTEYISKNNLIKYTAKNKAGTITEIRTFEYIFDDNGFPVKRKQNKTYPGETVNGHFRYYNYAIIGSE